jgi:hypothetical protein
LAITDPNYTARFELPEEIERGRAETIQCPVYLDGSLVAPSSGTVSVFNANNEAVVDEQAVSINADIAEYDIGSSVMDNEELSTGWQVRWTLTISGADFVFINSAALVRSRLWPVVADTDLFRRCPSIDPSDSGVITSETDYQSYLDGAWIEIMHRVMAKGNRPWLIMEPTALRNAHMYFTLFMIFDGLAARSPDNDRRMQAEDFYKQYEEAWRELQFEYDYDQDGFAEGIERKPSRNIWML